MNNILFLTLATIFTLSSTPLHASASEAKQETKTKSAEPKIEVVSPETARKHIEAIKRLSRDAFIENHEITKHYYKGETEDKRAKEFLDLFDAHVVDMIEEIQKQKGLIFLVFNDKSEVIGISVGRPYGCPALSAAFMERVFKSQTSFKEVMGGWWKLMEKYQTQDKDRPEGVYHQAMTAIDPKYAGKGVGTALSKHVMETITNPEHGYKALARETSSTPSHKVAEKLTKTCTVVPIDEQVHEATKVALTLRIQYKNENEAQAILQWFKKKKSAVSTTA